MVILKRILSLLLLVSITLTLGSRVKAATPRQDTLTPSIESILSDFHEKCQLAGINSSTEGNSRSASSSDQLIQETVDTLVNAGYEAYNVNKDTFDEVEEVLSTDLNAIGLSEDYSYIVVLSGETPSNGSTRDAYGGTPGNSFSYTYNGTTYTLRYMTVTAANMPMYGKASTVNLLNSKSQTIINNCLNTAITMYLGAVWAPLGTVASLTGFDISDFMPDATATLNLNAATNWTRVFTQVLDYDGSWTYGSSVEYAKSTYYFSGHYYDAATDSYTKVSDDGGDKTEYSDHYFDYTWRKTTAINSLFSIATYDMVGPIKYAYNGEVKITHELNYY